MRSRPRSPRSLPSPRLRARRVDPRHHVQRADLERYRALFEAEIKVATQGRGSYDVTRKVTDAVAGANVQTGLCHLFNVHTSASLMLCENADPDVRRDLETFMADLVPDGDPRFVHTAEGPDDMPAHVRSVLTQSELTIPIRGGRLALGTWQGIYLWEHRTRPHERRLLITVLG